jgi:hypothetical protein
MSFFARVLGLPALVLFSPYWDWSVWIVSGNAFAWVCLALTKPEARWMLYLGLLTMVGSVLEILPTVVPDHGPLMAVSWLGGVLMSLAVIASILISVRNPRVFSISSATAARLLFTFFFALTIPLQVWSIATLTPLPRAPRDRPLFSVFLGFEKLLGLLLPITVISFVLLVTEWLWFPLVAKVTAGLWHGILGGNRTPLVDKGKSSSFGWIILVGVSSLLGAFVSAYQWSRGYPLGPDARYYSFVLRRMDALGVQIAFSTERPFFFLILYAFEKIFGLEASTLLRLAPVALAMILVAATYLFTKVVVGDEKVAAIAAAFAAISPHTTVGVEYFIVANWFGLVLMMLFLYVFVRTVTRRSVLWAFLTIALSGLVLGVHYFTWLFMIFVILAYFLMSLLGKRFSDRRDMVFCTIVVLGCIAVLIPALFFAYQAGGGTLESLLLVEGMIGTFLTQATPMNFIGFLRDQGRIYSYFGMEHYAIPLLFVLALVGFVKLRFLASDRGRLLKSWLIASCLGILVVPYEEWWRFLYVLPLEILAALGLAAILGYVGLLEKSSQVSTIRDDLTPIALLLLVFFTLGLLLIFSSLSSLLLFLSLVSVILVELRWPSKGWGRIVFVILVSLVLEQVSRALYALA